jgi:hypothetical protein
MLAAGSLSGHECSTYHSAWQEWREAVKKSSHVKELQELVEQPPNRPGAEPVEPDLHFRSIAERNLQLEELWARSYAQYILTRAGELELLARLVAFGDPVDDDFPEHTVPRQWSDRDFESIGQSIDNLFTGLGWR